MRQPDAGPTGPALVVHGGAGPHSDGQRDPKLAGAKNALDVGWEILAGGGDAVTAAEAAVRSLEEDPLFDAGFGSYLNQDGEVEVDAIIMDGATLRFGSVAAVARVRHAVSLARLVLEMSPHSMLAGQGAMRFAERHGLLVPAVSLIAPGPLDLWRASQDGGVPVAQPAPDAGAGAQRSAPAAAESGLIQGTAGETVGALGDTVGAVARDVNGHVAAATSTGGTRGKLPGRVGDSPIVGSGAYADDATGAISSTGHGESIMRVCMAYRCSLALSHGASATEAARIALHDLEERTGGRAGLIVVSAAGDVGWAFNTEAMPTAWRTAIGEGELFAQASLGSGPP